MSASIWRKFMWLSMLVLLLAACAPSAGMPAAPSIEELCVLLDHFPGSDLGCVITDAAVQNLLEEAFPPGQATADEVHDKLGLLLIRSSVTSQGRVREEYAILATLFPDDPDLAIFQYDENGIVWNIDYAE